MSPKARFKKSHFGMLLSLVFLVLVAYKLDFKAFAAILSDIQWPWLLPAIAVKLAALYCKSLRWRSLIKATGVAQPAFVKRALFLGYAGNAVMPAKLGELLRLKLVMDHNGMSLGEVLATIMVERTFDIVVLMVFFLGTAYFAVLPPWAMQGGIPALFLLGAVCAVIGSFLFFQPAVPTFSFTPAYVRTFIAKLNNFLVGVKNGMGSVKSPITLMVAFATTFAAWILEALGIYVFMLAFAIDVSPLAPFVLVVIVTLGVAIPSAPAGVGTHQFLYMLCLQPFGISSEVAVSLSLTITITMILTLVLVGIAIAWHTGISLKSIDQLARTQSWDKTPEP